MLDLKEVDRIAARTANVTLGVAGVQAQSREAIGSQGEDILEITLVLPNGTEKELEGDKPLKTLVQIGRDLQRHDEDRFPVIIWRMESDRAPDVDPEA